MGKALFIFFALFGTLALMLLVPVSGRTFWDRAVERGIPQAIGRDVAHGLRSGWDWVMTHGERDERRAAPPRRAPAKAVAKAPARPKPARDLPSALPERDEAAPPAAPKSGRDGIVAQPPRESLQDDDRAALDRLVSNRR